MKDTSKATINSLLSHTNRFSNGSNPAEITNESPKIELIRAVFEFQKKCASKSVPVNKHNKPYRLAKLVSYPPGINKRWHVDFWAWDIDQDQMVRVRLFKGLNYKKLSYQERIANASTIISIVNQDLIAGKMLGSGKPKIEALSLKKLTILQAIDFVAEKKASSQHRKSYVRSFQTLKTNINAWLKHEGIKDFPLSEFNTTHAFKFSDYLKEVKKLSNKSHNNYKDTLATVIYFLNKREPGLIKSNPVEAIDSLPTVTRKHAIYSAAQIESITRACKSKGYSQLLLFIQTMYYTLARPREIISLKIKNVNIAESKIFFTGEVSKNWMDEYVTIPESLKNFLLDSQVLNRPPEHYLFGSRNDYTKPLWGIKPLYEQNREIITQLGFHDKTYTLYSYKHSGAVNLYQQTKDIKLLQRQCRHKSIEMTNIYLRDLGLMLDEQLKEWVGAM